MTIAKIKEQETIIAKYDELTIENIYNEFVIGIESIAEIAYKSSMEHSHVEAIIRYCLTNY